MRVIKSMLTMSTAVQQRQLLKLLPRILKSSSLLFRVPTSPKHPLCLPEIRTIPQTLVVELVNHGVEELSISGVLRARRCCPIALRHQSPPGLTKNAQLLHLQNFPRSKLILSNYLLLLFPDLTSLARSSTAIPKARVKQLFVLQVEQAVFGANAPSW